MPIHSRLLPTFSSIEFSVSDFMFKSLIHLEQSFIQSDRCGCICFHLHADIQLDQKRLLQMLSFSIAYFQSLSKFKCPQVDGLLLGFLSFPLINLSVFTSIPCRFYYYCSIVPLEIKGGDISRSFIGHDCYSNLGPFVSPYEAEYYSFKICKELCWNFYGNCADSVD